MKLDNNTVTLNVGSLIASIPAPIVIDMTYTGGTASASNILINVTGTIKLIN